MKVVENTSYFGSFMPDTPTALLKVLVWSDGDSPETRQGSYGNYLRFNNSHKAFLYLASLSCRSLKRVGVGSFHIREELWKKRWLLCMI